MQAGVVRGVQRGFQGLDRRERILQLDQLTRRDALRGDPSRNPFQIPHQRHLLADDVRQIRILREALHHVQTFVDPGRVLDRHGDPALQETAAHRRQRAVDDVRETALLARPVRGEEFQIADRELVDPHVVLLVDARNRRDVARIAVFGEFQIVENRPRSRDAAREVVDAEAFERRRAELFAQFLAVDFLRENPLVESVGIEPRPEGSRETILVTALIDNLFRLKVRQQLVHVGVRALGHVELARRDIQKRHARRLAAEVDRGDEVVLLVGQDVVPQHDTRGNQFDDAPLDEPLHQFRVLELFADRDPLACADQFRKVTVDGMVGKSRQFDVGGCAVGPAGERDAQDAACLDGVVAERLVEIPYAEEQNGVGMHRLDRIILLHQGRLDVFPVDILICFLICGQSKGVSVSSTKIGLFRMPCKAPGRIFFAPNALADPGIKRCRQR